AHINRVGVRVVCFRGSIPTPPILYLRFAGSLTVAAQDSMPSGSLLLSCKASSSSASCRFIPAHQHPHFTHNQSVLSVIACSYGGGTLTRLAMRSQNHAKASPIGSPIRLCMGSFPLATSSIPNTAAPTYIIPSQNRRRRRYRGSRSARSTDLHT